MVLISLENSISIAAGMLRSLHSFDMVKPAAAVQCSPEARHTLEYSRVLASASGHIIAGLVTIPGLIAYFRIFRD